MESNQTVKEFVIVGFSILTNYQPLLFTVLLVLCFIIITGNGGIACSIFYDPELHSPMYFFICTLSMIEIGIVTTVYPTLLVIILTGKAHISFNNCLMQIYVFHSLLIMENILLNIMAYDRYIAICNALRYHAIMTLGFCKLLIVGCWFCGFTTPLVLLILVYKLTFCGPNEIHHLLCEFVPLVTLACENNTISILVELAISSFTVVVTSFLTVMTYTKILVTIFKMKTAVERRKAFSTCASNLIVAFFFYGSLAFMYIHLEVSYSRNFDMATALHHSVLTPLFSSLTYSLRNKKLKKSMKKCFRPHKICNRIMHNS